MRSSTGPKWTAWGAWGPLPVHFRSSPTSPWVGGRSRKRSGPAKWMDRSGPEVDRSGPEVDADRPKPGARERKQTRRQSACTRHAPQPTSAAEPSRHGAKEKSACANCEGGRLSFATLHTHTYIHTYIHTSRGPSRVAPAGGRGRQPAGGRRRAVTSAPARPSGTPPAAARSHKRKCDRPEVTGTGPVRSTAGPELVRSTAIHCGRNPRATDLTICVGICDRSNANAAHPPATPPRAVTSPSRGPGAWSSPA